MLSNSNTGFDEHVQDVLAVVRHCMRTGVDKEKQFANAVYVFGFIIRRVYPKIHARLTNWKSLWKIHPIRALVDIYKHSTTFTQARFDLQSHYAVKVLARYSIPPCSAGTALFEVSPQNAAEWCRVLVDCIGKLEKPFNAEGEARPPALTYEEMFDLYNTMALLDVLITTGIVAHLLRNAPDDALDCRVAIPSSSRLHIHASWFTGSMIRVR